MQQTMSNFKKTTYVYNTKVSVDVTTWYRRHKLQIPTYIASPASFANKISVFSRDRTKKRLFCPVLSFVFKVLTTLQRAHWFYVRWEDKQC